MFPNIVIGGLALVLGLMQNVSFLFSVFLCVVAFLFLLAPFVMWEISKEKTYIRKIDKLNNSEKDYIKNIAEKTWNYFDEYMTKENSFLPPDNFQESRRQRVVDRTSSTNIGLSLLTIISAYDLKFIDLEKAIVKLENSLNTINSLEKWNGHLYNWYNIKSLKPLMPRYISTVDSGNFVRIYVYFKRVFRRKAKYTV